MVYRLNNELQAGWTTSEIPSEGRKRNICDNFLIGVYVTEGSGRYCLHNGSEFRYFSGSLFLRLPGVAHDQLHDPGRYSEFYLSLPAHFAELLIQKKLADIENPVMHPGLYEWIEIRFKELIHELAEQREDRLMISAAHLFEFLVELLLTRSVKFPHCDLILKSANFLSKNPEQHISIADVAEHVGIPLHNFRRLFKKYFNVSPGEYRIRKRIESIQELLRTSDVTLKETAERFGYADVYTFTRQFRKYTGSSPARFRKLIG